MTVSDKKYLAIMPKPNSRRVEMLQQELDRDG